MPRPYSVLPVELGTVAPNAPVDCSLVHPYPISSRVRSRRGAAAIQCGGASEIVTSNNTSLLAVNVASNALGGENTDVNSTEWVWTGEHARSLYDFGYANTIKIPSRIRYPVAAEWDRPEGAFVEVIPAVPLLRVLHLNADFGSNRRCWQEFWAGSTNTLNYMLRRRTRAVFNRTGTRRTR